MSAILELARRLGKAIAESSEAAELRAAAEKLNADEALGETLKAYQEQHEKVADLRQANKPIEVDDKHKLSELEDRLASSEVFKRFTAAQVEFVDVMRKVSEAMHADLSDIEDVL